MSKDENLSHRMATCLWFDGQAEEAARFYVSVFGGPRSRITQVTHFGSVGREVHGREPGSVMVVAFELDGAPYTALNGGPHFKFNPAISIQVMCETQAEIDRLWDQLSAGGDPRAQQCGWLADKYGLSWQIVPSRISAWSDDRDRAAADRVMAALLPMKKLDMAKLEAAHAGR